MPEETLTLNAVDPEQKAIWLQELQNAIKCSLGKTNAIQPPSVRSATYTFTKHRFYKDGKYTGRWSNGKMNGSGKVEWNDGRVYIGQFNNNMFHGFGKMEVVTNGEIYFYLFY